MNGRAAAHSGSEIALPTVFGRYLLLRRMSRGGMGEIYLARSGELQGMQKLCVIKKILPTLAQNAEFTRRFVDEAALTIKLNHVNIVPVFEVGMVSGDYFLALDYVEGRDLRRILSRCYEARTAVPPDLALYIAREMANGLAYAHRRKDDDGRPLKLVHCDISPPNVLVSIEGEVKLIDFGVARSAIALTQDDPGVGFGKYGYMAPEQIIKGREIDPRTDIYATGVVLFEMLVGDRMLEFAPGADFREIARAVVLGKQPLPSERRPELGTAFDHLVVKATAKDPGDRYQSGAEFRDDLQRALVQINPTISPDKLAVFVREQFGADLAEDRRLYKQASDADYSAFQEQFTDAIESTVSYALTDAWGQATGTWSTSDGVPADSTRPAPAQDEPRSRRGVGLLVGIGAGLIAIVAILLFVIGGGDKRRPPKPKPAPAVASAPEDAAAPTIMTLDLTMDVPVDPPPPDREMSTPMATPKPMSRRRWRPRPTAMKAAPRPEPMRPDGPSKAAVMAKFRRVRARYASFRSEFGQRLESHWQRILKTAVYSGADRYKRLGRLIDGLNARMSAIRKKSQ